MLKWLTDTRLLYGTNVNQQLNRLTPCLPFNRKEGSSPLLCPWSSHGLYVIQLRLRSCACAHVGSLASVPWRPVPLQHTSPKWPNWPGLATLTLADLSTVRCENGHGHGQMA